MRKPGLRAVAAIIMTCLTLALLGCFGLLFPSSDTNPSSRLVALKPTQLQGGTWTVVIVAKEVPDGGLAGILIENGGLVFSNVLASSIEADGLGGFIVTAQDFEEGSSHGMLVAINTSDGVIDGKVLKLTFLAMYGSPTVTIDESKIVLLSDHDALLLASVGK